MADGGIELSAQVKQQIHILKKAQNRRTADDLKKLGATFKDVKFFKDLEASVRTQVCRGLKLEHYATGAAIFNEGDAGDRFYILLAGSVGVYIKEVQAQDVDVEGEEEEKPSRISFGRTKSQEVITYEADDDGPTQRRHCKSISTTLESKSGEGSQQAGESEQPEAPEQTENAEPQSQMPTESQAQPSSVAQRRKTKFNSEGSALATNAVRQTLRDCNRSSMLSFLSTGSRSLDRQLLAAQRRRSSMSMEGSKRGSGASLSLEESESLRKNYLGISQLDSKDAGRHNRDGSKETVGSRSGSKDTHSSAEASEEWTGEENAPGKNSHVSTLQKSPLKGNDKQNGSQEMRPYASRHKSIISQVSGFSLQSEQSHLSIASSQGSRMGTPSLPEPKGKTREPPTTKKRESRRFSNIDSGDLAIQAKLATANLKSCLKTSDRNSDSADWFDSMRSAPISTSPRAPGSRKRASITASVEEAPSSEDMCDASENMTAIEEEGEELENTTLATPEAKLDASKILDRDCESCASQSEVLPVFTQALVSVHSSEARSPAGTPVAADDPQVPLEETKERGTLRLCVGTAAITFLEEQVTLLYEKQSNTSGTSHSASDSFGSSSESEMDEDPTDLVPRIGTPALGGNHKSSGILGHAVDSDSDASPQRNSVFASKVSPMAKRLQRLVRKQSWGQIIPKMQEVAVLQAGAAFGEVALQTNAPRSATIRTKSETYLASLTRDDYMSILQSFFEKQQEDRKSFLRSMPLIQDIHPSGIQKICALMMPRTLTKNQCVYKVGQPILEIYFAKEGEFGVCYSISSPTEAKEDGAPSSAKGRASMASFSPRQEPQHKLQFVTTSLLNPPCVVGLASYLMGERRYRHRVICLSVVGVVYCILAKEVVQFLSRQHREHLQVAAYAEEQFGQNRLCVLKHLHAPLEHRAGSSYGRRRLKNEETMFQKLEVVRGDVQSDFSAYSFEGRLRTIGRVFTESHGKHEKHDGAVHSYVKHFEEDNDDEETPSKIIPRNPQLQVTWYMQKVIATHPDAINPRYGHLLRMKHRHLLDVDVPAQPSSSIPVVTRKALADYGALAKASWQNPRLASAFDANCFHAPTLERQPRGRADGKVQMVRRVPEYLQLQAGRNPRAGRILQSPDVVAASPPQAENLESKEPESHDSCLHLPKLVADTKECDVGQESISPESKSPREFNFTKVELPQIALKSKLLSICQPSEDDSTCYSPATDLSCSPISCCEPFDFFADHLVASSPQRVKVLVVPLPAGQGLSKSTMHQGSAASLLAKSCHTCSTASFQSRCTAGSSKSDASTSVSINLDSIYKQGRPMKIVAPAESPRKRHPHTLPRCVVDSPESPRQGSSHSLPCSVVHCLS